MLNFFFALFLFGLLCFFCFRALYRVIRYRQGFTIQEFALVTALFIGTLLALHMGISKM